MIMCNRISGFSDEICPDLPGQVKAVKRLGLDYISLRGIQEGKSIGDVSLEEAKDCIKPLLDDSNIKVSSISSPIGKIFLDDKEGFSSQIEMLKRLSEIAHLLDCRNIRIFSFYLEKGIDVDSCKREVEDKLYEFVKIAEENDLLLLHENEKDIFGDSPRRCASLFSDIVSKAFSLIFDFANFVQCGYDTIDAYNLLCDKISYVHIKDYSIASGKNVVCGQGDGNIPILLDRLISSGYNGFFTLEPHLVHFSGLDKLELKEARQNAKYVSNNGYDAFAMQLKALNEILDRRK